MELCLVSAILLVALRASGLASPNRTIGIAPAWRLCCIPSIRNGSRGRGSTRSQGKMGYPFARFGRPDIRRCRSD